jgi:hypothetical protein
MTMETVDIEDLRQ